MRHFVGFAAFFFIAAPLSWGIDVEIRPVHWTDFESPQPYSTRSRNFTVTLERTGSDEFQGAIYCFGQRPSTLPKDTLCSKTLHLKANDDLHSGDTSLPDLWACWTDTGAACPEDSWVSVPPWHRYGSYIEYKPQELEIPFYRGHGVVNDQFLFSRRLPSLAEKSSTQVHIYSLAHWRGEFELEGKSHLLIGYPLRAALLDLDSLEFVVFEVSSPEVALQKIKDCGETPPVNCLTPVGLSGSYPRPALGITFDFKGIHFSATDSTVLIEVQPRPLSSSD